MYFSLNTQVAFLTARKIAFTIQGGRKFAIWVQKTKTFLQPLLHFLLPIDNLIPFLYVAANIFLLFFVSPCFCSGCFFTWKSSFLPPLPREVLCLYRVGFVRRRKKDARSQIGGDSTEGTSFDTLRHNGSRFLRRQISTIYAKIYHFYSHPCISATGYRNCNFFKLNYYLTFSL